MGASEVTGLQAFPPELDDREDWLEPFGWYAEMRENAPVRYDQSRGTWDVFRYQDVKTILADDERFSTSPREADDFREPPEGGFLLDTMLLQDPPRHGELRSVVDDAFDPRSIRDLEPRIRTLTNRLLDEALPAEGGTFDLVDSLAYPLPVIVIADLLGVPSEDRARFKQWSDLIVQGVSDDVDTESYLERQEAAGGEMAQYFLEQIEDRRQRPRDDLLTTIATTEGEGGQLSHREALGMCMLLLIAGNITTTNLVTNAVRCFDAFDGNLFPALADDGRRLAAAIEEVLRYRSPVQAMARVSLEDVELGGETLEAGDRVVVWLGSANRDERQFADADAFVPDRSPNQHLGFGYGTHYCLGAPLARLEAKVALDELSNRLTDIEVTTPDSELRPVRSSFIYGVEHLSIRSDESGESLP